MVRNSVSFRRQTGDFLDDVIGIRFIDKAVKLGIRNIAIHKGLSFGPQSYAHSTCVDIGPVAKRYPNVNFLIYHSGLAVGTPEGPYDEKRTDGIDARSSDRSALNRWSTRSFPMTWRR